MGLTQIQPVAAGTDQEVLTAPVLVQVAPEVPPSIARPVTAALQELNVLSGAGWIQPLRVVRGSDNATTFVELTPLRQGDQPLAVRFFAPVAQFSTVADALSLEELQKLWLEPEGGATYVTPEAVDWLPAVLGPRGEHVQVVNPAEMLAALEQDAQAIGLMAFDQLDPRFKVLAVDGFDVLSNQLDPEEYPLAAAVHLRGPGASSLAARLAQAAGPATNRDPARLTTLIMTGVTAITRGTAAAIERNDVLYPAAIISDTLRAADITHISNEVPFLDDCVVNNTLNNLILCSHTDYWATLEALGTDIVGLSGNHVNDFGRDGARRSLQFYRDNNIAIYGSGSDIEQACAPLFWQHNGNTFAFLAALAFDPPSARATEDEPGACYYYDHRQEILARIAELAQTTDIVAVELQFEESYDAVPLARQVEEFRALRAAGADLVTGVQSHVPQAMEPYGLDDEGGPGVIAYGLGNLFFDQMWSWATRTELLAQHTVYDGRLLNTQVLTAVLEDFAQPRWADAEERAEILTRIFNAAPPPRSRSP